MANIPSGVILIWAGTNASIPSGWTRETTLDDKFPKGHGAENPNTTGGTTTHTHTSSGHTHSLAAHTHTATYGAGNAPNNPTWRKQAGTGTPKGEHTHTVTTDNSSAVTSSSTAATYGSCSNNPPYYEVIFIKPSSSPVPIGAGIISHYNGDTVPDGYYYCDGSNSTPDLRNKYLKGAGTGANGGGTGGSTTNVHSITHGHTIGNHTHTFTTSTYTGRDMGRNSGWIICTSNHNHSGTTGNSSSNTVNDGGGNLTTTETVEPAYKKLGTIQCSTPKLVVGLVGLWLGTVANIPANWQVCDGSNGTVDMRDKFVKIPASLANNGDTGGSNTHTHAAQGHTHTGASHTHSLPQFDHNINGSGNGDDGSGYLPLVYSGNYMVYHDAITSGATSLSLSSSNTTAESSSNQPAYRTVAYIQLMNVPVGGGFFLNMI